MESNITTGIRRAASHRFFGSIHSFTDLRALLTAAQLRFRSMSIKEYIVVPGVSILEVLHPRCVCYRVMFEFKTILGVLFPIPFGTMMTEGGKQDYLAEDGNLGLGIWRTSGLLSPPLAHHEQHHHLPANGRFVLPAETITIKTKRK
jgi:hypothetical protein